MSKITTVKEATYKWVAEFNAIPQSLIEKAYPNLVDGEVDVLSTERICVACGSGDRTHSKSGVDVCSDCECADFDTLHDLPMWGTMWSFGTGLDDDWVRENLDIVRECGFWVYESCEIGVFIGINGAGYDFYESHWIPLYKARGLKWHSVEE